MQSPDVEIKHANDGSIMVFVTSDRPVYVYRLDAPAEVVMPNKQRPVFELIQGGRR